MSGCYNCQSELGGEAEGDSAIGAGEKKLLHFNWETIEEQGHSPFILYESKG